jgi:hypothetical protein
MRLNNIKVLCTFGCVSQINICYKYFAALLHLLNQKSLHLI